MMDFDFNKFESLARRASYLENGNISSRERYVFLNGCYWAFEHFRKEYISFLKDKKNNDLYLSEEIRSELNGSN